MPVDMVEDALGESTTRSSIDYGKDDESSTYVDRLVRRIECCLKELGIKSKSDGVLTTKVEAMSTLIYESMSISSRDYHSVQHVFDISKHIVDPIAILAALFHDCIYYNIDGGLSKVQDEKLQGVLLTEQESDGQTKLCISPDACSGDELLAIVIEVFGRTPGDDLSPMTGLNEFLSAVIAVRELESVLPKEVLAAIACCIEATIPFRSTDPLLGTPLERLYSRMLTTTRNFNLNFTEEQCVLCVQRAAILSNEDVGNFGSEDQLWFLDNTWSLLPESNEALRHKLLYTVKDFQFGLFKMYGFFGFLKPSVIFNQFRDVPSDEDLDRLTANAERNLDVGKKYVGAKLLSLSILAAIAELTGGDAPVSVFMGDLPSQDQTGNRLEDWLPEPKKISNEKCDADVYEILAFGRRSDEGVKILLRDVAVYPMDKERATTLLTSLPREAAIHVTKSIAEMTVPRREMIESQVLPLLANLAATS